MIGKPGPFQIIDSDCSDRPAEPPRRRYTCPNYESCLNLAAALNWDNYTCRGCSGEVNQNYLWRAKCEIKKDKIVQTICDEIPELTYLKNTEDLKQNKGRVLQVVEKNKIAS